MYSDRTGEVLLMKTLINYVEHEFDQISDELYLLAPNNFNYTVVCRDGAFQEDLILTKD
jgi:hypothetical protein